MGGEANEQKRSCPEKRQYAAGKADFRLLCNKDVVSVDGLDGKYTRFGAEIENADGSGGCRVSDISGSEAETEEFVKLLAENEVTPVALQDVAYDWLCSKF
ncbi:MAG: DUF6514 family protein [Oscillospiraceae bacterium]